MPSRFSRPIASSLSISLGHRDFPFSTPCVRLASTKPPLRPEAAHPTRSASIKDDPLIRIALGGMQCGPQTGVAGAHHQQVAGDRAGQPWVVRPRYVQPHRAEGACRKRAFDQVRIDTGIEHRLHTAQTTGVHRPTASEKSVAGPAAAVDSRRYRGSGAGLPSGPSLGARRAGRTPPVKRANTGPTMARMNTYGVATASTSSIDAPTNPMMTSENSPRAISAVPARS